METRPLLGSSPGPRYSSASQRRAAGWLGLLLGLLALLTIATTMTPPGRWVRVERLPADQGESTMAAVAALEEAMRRQDATSAKRSSESDGSRTSGVIIDHGGTLRLVPDLRAAANATALASAVYQRNVSGWNRFVGTAMPLKPGDRKAYLRSMEALGFIEGLFTCREIQDFYVNFYSAQFEGGDPSDDVIDFITETYTWVSKRAEREHMSSDYWLVVRGVLLQLEGMRQGAIEGCSLSNMKSDHTNVLRSFDSPSLLHLLLVNNNGDFMQILPKFDPISMEGRFLPSRRLSESKSRKEHCSALIKLLPGNVDILFGHTTWDDYQCMGPRILKSYTIPTFNGTVTRMDFSSSPGMVMSIDDFYIIQIADASRSTMVVMETSLPIFDTSLLNRIHTNSVPYWVRVRVANQLAGNHSPDSIC